MLTDNYKKIAIVNKVVHIDRKTGWIDTNINLNLSFKPKTVIVMLVEQEQSDGNPMAINSNFNNSRANALNVYVGKVYVKSFNQTNITLESYDAQNTPQFCVKQIIAIG